MKKYIKLACMIAGIGMILSPQLMAKDFSTDCSSLNTGKCHKCCVENFKVCKNACTGNDWKKCMSNCKVSFATCRDGCKG